ncbi:MAG: imidazole glycerol phosphate synthase subunit HisH [Phycisphaerae bacterium]|nr:imidazole glycerol phosphate synthase subunit HisH [Phycisphaerae bacterium]
MTNVLLLDTGAGNRASLVRAFARLGARVDVAADPGDVAAAACVVVPGVGAFGNAVRTLRVAGYADALLDRIASDRPTVGICVGLQILCAASDESPGVSGLGVFPSMVRRFASTPRPTHYGWNRVRGFCGDGYAAFAHGYRVALDEAPSDADVAVAEFGGPFVAALRRGALIALQFHPELSGAFGLAALASALDGSAVRC